MASSCSFREGPKKICSRQHQFYRGGGKKVKKPILDGVRHGKYFKI